MPVSYAQQQRDQVHEIRRQRLIVEEERSVEILERPEVGNEDSSDHVTTVFLLHVAVKMCPGRTCPPGTVHGHIS